MKLKALSLVAGAIALTLTATSFAVEAQTASPSPVLLAQTPQQPKGPWQELGVTDAQKTQIQAIRQTNRAKMEAVFTPEQKTKLEAAKQARRTQRQAGQEQAGQRSRKDKFADLNLTEAQKAQIRQIRESEKQQIQAVLTPEQQQKLAQFRESMKQRRQQRNSQ